MTAHPLLLRAARLPQPRLLQVGLWLWVGSSLRVALLVAVPDVCCWLGREVAHGEWLSQVGWAVPVARSAPVSRPYRPDSNRPAQPVLSSWEQILSALAVARHRARVLAQPVRVLVQSLETRRGVRYGCRVRTPPGI